MIKGWSTAQTLSRWNIVLPSHKPPKVVGCFLEAEQVHKSMIRLARLLCFLCTILLFAHKATQRNTRTTMSKSKAAQQEKNQCSMPFFYRCLCGLFKWKKAKLVKANLALTVNIENATNFWQPITCNAAEEKEIGAAKRNEDTTGSRHCIIPGPVTNTIGLFLQTTVSLDQAYA